MIYCIGRNYRAHATELGNPISNEKPVVFFKPAAAVTSSGTVQLPKFSKEIHYEAEMALKLGPRLEISEIAIANDLTARDIQREAQNARGPWALAKGFKNSCGIGNWAAAKNFDLNNLELKCLLNGRLVQRGFTKDMVYSPDHFVAYLKENFPMMPGDIILTGTPDGVGRVQAGDKIEMELVGISKAEWHYE